MCLFMLMVSLYSVEEIAKEHYEGLTYMYAMYSKKRAAEWSYDWRGWMGVITIEKLSYDK